MRHTKGLFSLEGRVAIVTGGRGLYGANISLGLCEMGAMVGKTKYMAGRYGKDGIRVNCIAPGGYNPKESGVKNGTVCTHPTYDLLCNDTGMLTRYRQLT